MLTDGLWWRTPVIVIAAPEDLSEFEAGLVVYRKSSRTVRDTQRNSVSKNTKQSKKRKRNKEEKEKKKEKERKEKSLCSLPHWTALVYKSETTRPGKQH